MIVSARRYLETILILARGSVEGAKNKIDKICTTRGLMPELCMNFSVQEYSKLFECVRYIPLPKVCPTDKTRIMMTQFIPEKMDAFSILSYFRYNLMVGEYRAHHDYTIAERFVIDLNNVSQMTIITKVNPIVVKKAEIIATEAYGTKIKGIHLLNAPPFVDKLIFLLKQALKEKVASRIHVHYTLEDFHKLIPKEVLPKDYGGDEPTLEKLSELWQETLRTEEATKIISNINNIIADESKRPTNQFNQEYMGMPGSFRKLNVD
ncbi:hypothetical protein evm_007792 [Chilo suppressalis]|nr:hypothetical protein evm_007792 [Chilo suppressalis]